jgi:hypothetical protein
MLCRGVRVSIVGASMRALASPILQNRRSIIVLTQQSKMLANIATANKYTSEIWVDDEGLWQTQSKPIDGAKPSTVQATKRLELYNESQLTEPLGLHEATLNASVVTGKEYSGAFELDLEQHRATNGFQSRWWIGMGQIKKRKLVLKRKYGKPEQPVTVLLRVATHVYNSEQLDKPSIAELPFSAYSMKPYFGENAKNLSEFCVKQGFKRRIFLTENQAKKFGVEILPTAVGVSLSSAMNRLYNVGDLEDPAAILGKIKEDVTTEGLSPVYTSGKSVQPEALAVQLQEYQMKRDFKHSVWLGIEEIRAAGAKLRDGSVGVDRDMREIRVYNAEQTSDPDAVYLKAGTIL